jgi:hypothetical protein
MGALCCSSCRLYWTAKAVMAAAHGLEPERRDLFLQRCAAMLRLQGVFDDADVAVDSRASARWIGARKRRVISMPG